MFLHLKYCVLPEKYCFSCKYYFTCKHYVLYVQNFVFHVEY